MSSFLLHHLIGNETEAEEYGGFLRRSTLAATALAFGCLLASALFARWDWFLGLLLGSAVSLFHFRLLVRSAIKWFHRPGKVRGSKLWRDLFFRLLITVGLLGLSILYLPLNILGLALGLFVVQGGLLLSFALQGFKLEEG